MAWARSNTQLVSEGMPGRIREKVIELITQKKNGIISGDEGSGKGNLLVALVAVIAERQRVFVIESPVQIRGRHANIVTLPEAGRVRGVHPPEAVLAAALDHDPAHTVVGYIRNESDYRLLRAVNEQHGGTLSTVHATSATEALDQLRRLAASAQLETHPGCPGAEIASDIGFVLHCEHDPMGRKRVASLLAVTGYNAGSNEFETEELYRAPNTHAA